MEGGFWAWFCKRTLRTRTSAGTAGSRVGRARMPGGRRGRTGAAGTGWDGADRGVESAAGGVADQIVEENTHRRARKDGGEPRGLTVLCGRLGSSALKSARKGLQRQIFRKISGQIGKRRRISEWFCDIVLPVRFQPCVPLVWDLILGRRQKLQRKGPPWCGAAGVFHCLGNESRRGQFS